MQQVKILLKQYSETAMQLKDGKFDIIIDRPVAKGGHGNGLMGGQYLLAGIGGCFCSTLFAAAQSRNLDIDGLRVEVIATLNEDVPKRFASVHLEVSYKRCNDPDEFRKLLKIAEKGCLSINTIKEGMGFTIGQKKE